MTVRAAQMQRAMATAMIERAREDLAADPTFTFPKGWPRELEWEAYSGAAAAMMVAARAAKAARSPVLDAMAKALFEHLWREVLHRDWLRYDRNADKPGYLAVAQLALDAARAAKPPAAAR